MSQQLIKPNEGKTETTTIHESKYFPFNIVERSTQKGDETEQEFLIVVSNAIMTELEFKDFQSAEDYIAARPWDLIINLLGYTIEKRLEYEKLNAETRS